MSATIEELRHSAAHLMASAVCAMFDNVKIDIGPATDDASIMILILSIV